MKAETRSATARASSCSFSSRVRTLAGIFLENSIPDDIDFSPNPDDLEMMERGKSP
jgi:hypothetical protein